MVLEATIICIDNSEWMRNDDYSPSRFQAQADASNLKNMVGILTMAGKGVRVLATPTSELGKILPCMHGTYFFQSCLETIRTLEVRVLLYHCTPKERTWVRT
ncbi:hypothetical protein V6Z11_D04G066700 [Gossypium hirsutum]